MFAFRKQKPEMLRKERMVRNLNYRRNMGEIKNNEKKMEQLYKRYVTQAVEAEAKGEHNLAVSFACQAQKIEKYHKMSSKMTDSVEAAHAVQESNAALTDILRTAGGLSEKWIDPAGPVELMQASADVSMVQENVQMLIEQGESAFDQMVEESDSPDENSERYLQKIIESSRRQRQQKLMQDTDRKLDRLARARNVE